MPKLRRFYIRHREIIHLWVTCYFIWAVGLTTGMVGVNLAGGEWSLPYALSYALAYLVTIWQSESTNKPTTE